MRQASALPALLASDWNQHAPGLVWAYRMAPGGSVHALAAGDVTDALQQTDGWVWLHIDLLDQRAHGWVGHACALPQPVRAILESHEENLALRHHDGVIYGVCADFHKEW